MPIRNELSGLAAAIGAALLATTVVVGQPARADSVSFSEDVMPILEHQCLECHTPGGPGFMESGLDLSTYDGVMQGTSYGVVVIPGQPMNSNLVRVIMGQVDPSIRMPQYRRPLPPRMTETIMRWVGEGALDN